MSPNQKKKPITVVLADDHEILRDGLHAMIDMEEDIKIVGTVGTGRSAVRIARKLRPAVVVMDIAMPDLNGIDATRRIASELPSVKVLCLSMHKEQSHVASMLRAGASGYLLKSCAGRELNDAIRIVASGETYISPSVAGDVVQAFVCNPSGTASGGIYTELTAREREILQLVAEGRNTKEIASLLGISDKTVHAHRGKLLDKLDCQSIADLTRYAIRQGMVDP